MLIDGQLAFVRPAVNRRYGYT